MAKVSVIIPCYNQAAYLGQALDSVRSQTYVDWEAIVIDDGSTDDTSRVALDYMSRDLRIRQIVQVNSGLSAARNAGIGDATGQYVAFLDADDAWEAGFLSTCIAAIGADSGLAGVYTQYSYFDGAGSMPRRVSGLAHGPRATREDLLLGRSSPVHAYLVRTAALRSAGPFDRDLTGLEDWDMWLRIAAQGDMAGIAEPLALYRVVVGSMSTDVERMHRNRIAVLTKHLGPPQGPPVSWLTGKRKAYACAYRAAAIQYVTNGQPAPGWEMLAQAAAIWPDILVQPETHYELACWDQPRGYRGHVESLQIERNLPLVLAGLERLFLQGGDALEDARRKTLAQAYLAFAMLADQAGRWRLARGYLLRAIGSDPRLLARRPFVRRLAKLCAGQRVVGRLRQLIRASAT